MGGGSQTTTQKSEPWPPAQPYIQHGVEEAAWLYGSSGPQYYPGQTVAPFAPETELAMNAQAARGLGGSPLNAAAGGYLQNVLGGQYANQGNP